MGWAPSYSIVTSAPSLGPKTDLGSSATAAIKPPIPPSGGIL